MFCYFNMIAAALCFGAAVFHVLDGNWLWAALLTLLAVVNAGLVFVLRY